MKTGKLSVSKFRGWKAACAVFLLCAATAIASPAQTFKTLVSFDGTDGSSPAFMSLVQGTDGNLYGTTTVGGTNNSYGTVFKLTPGGQADHAVQLLRQSELH
jgi:uncharacterized repeat protein (TIGR03803 family)